MPETDMERIPPRKPASLITQGLVAVLRQEFRLEWGGVLLTRTMMADVVDEDELNTGARRSGLFFGLLLTTSKAGAALGPITYAILGAAGFLAETGEGLGHELGAELANGCDRLRARGVARDRHR